mmetsp:Transcript_107459/g.300233  ORF Transcript_107459/g.300233 Transcript_107459/m.300233 type:complete len:226 (-) Transcript_107459:6-683(-)
MRDEPGRPHQRVRHRRGRRRAAEEKDRGPLRRPTAHPCRRHDVAVHRLLLQGVGADGARRHERWRQRQREDIWRGRACPECGPRPEQVFHHGLLYDPGPVRPQRRPGPARARRRGRPGNGGDCQGRGEAGRLRVVHHGGRHRGDLAASRVQSHQRLLHREGGAPQARQRPRHRWRRDDPGRCRLRRGEQPAAAGQHPAGRGLSHAHMGCAGLLSLLLLFPSSLVL